MKASLSAVDFAALLREGLWELEGLRLQKAWALGEAVVARFREPLAGERVLVLSPQVGVLETRYELPRTEPPRQLAEALRKLRGSKLVCVKQLNLDRVAALSLERGDRRVELVVEWVREGNLLVVEEGVVAAALRQREMRDRRVAVGESYEPPPPRGLDPLSVEPLDALPPGDSKRTAAAHLSRLVNAPGELVAEALYRCGVDPSTSSSQIHRSLAWRALRELKGMYLKVLRGELEPCLLLEAGEPAAAYPIKLEHLGAALEPAGSFSEAVDKVFSRLIARQPEAERGAALEAERLAAEYAARAEALRRAAAALMADLARFDSLIEELKELKRLLRWDLVEREMKAKHPEVVAADPAGNRLRVVVDGVEVELDATQTAARNASLLFEEAKDLERRAKRAAEAAGRLKPEAREQPALKLRRERRWFEGFHHFVSSEGFLVIGGRDAGQNEAIVRKYMRPSDVFLHADVHGGPVVVVKAEGREPGGATLLEAAQLAAAYSRAWEIGAAAVDVYWVKGEQVSKKPPSGEYLPRGAFMVYGRRNYIRRVKLELAVGAKVVDGSYELEAGPPSAIAKTCDAYVVLEPGRLPREEAARKVAELLAEALRAKGLKVKIPAHEVLSLLPKGGFHLSRRAPEQESR